MAETVKRFTTEYVTAEDRIRISVERGDDSLVLLWLTRRLAVRLVPQIVKVVDALPRLGGQAKAAAPSDNAQRRNQLDALGKIEQQAPVLSGELPGDIESHLINSLGVRVRSAGMLLDFKAGEDELIQTFPFTEEALRQWLALLNNTFRKAEWKEDIWPKWITAKGWDEGPDALRLN